MAFSLVYAAEIDCTRARRIMERALSRSWLRLLCKELLERVLVDVHGLCTIAGRG